MAADDGGAELIDRQVAMFLLQKGAEIGAVTLPRGAILALPLGVIAKLSGNTPHGDWGVLLVVPETSLKVGRAAWGR